MTGNDLCFLSALELRDLYRNREVSPVEVTEAALARIDRVNSQLNAFVTVTAEMALDQARRAEQAYARGEAPPLAGIPVSIKDLTATEGVRTARGSLLYQDWVPDFDAPVVERLKAAGAVILGKTNTPELGWKGDSGNRVFGPTHNPWKRGQTAGGSSGGAAAAVVAGLGALAQGSDGAGSIRIPAGFCGAYGLKPSLGLVPQFPASPVEFLSHFGPITRTVDDAALMLGVIAGADARDLLGFSAPTDYLAAMKGEVSGLRVAWSPDLGYAAVDPEVRRIAASAAARFEELGCRVEEAHPDLADPFAEIMDVIWASAFAGLYLHELDEVRDRMDPGLVAVIERGAGFSGPDLATALRRRNEYYQGWRVFMDQYDLVLTPTLPITAFTAGDDQPGQVDGRATSYLSWTAFTYPFNVTGQPAATVPCGFAADGLPVGLQIVGRRRDDAAVLRASAAFEGLSPWADKRPPLEDV
jgi:aspartyl-tRNA(Asn)/glutamyl-tRNA(Gln) amidotransferase subunit A